GQQQFRAVVRQGRVERQGGVEHSAAREDVEQPAGLEGNGPARRPGFLDSDLVARRGGDNIPIIAARVESNLRVAQGGWQDLRLVARFGKQGEQRRRRRLEGPLDRRQVLLG